MKDGGDMTRGDRSQKDRERTEHRWEAEPRTKRYDQAWKSQARTAGVVHSERE